MSTAVTTYNDLVHQQRDLTHTIEQALTTIASALETKLQLAEQQKHIQATIGLTYPEHGSADVRAKILDQVARRLEGRASTERRDWTMRRAMIGGNLEE